MVTGLSDLPDTFDVAVVRNISVQHREHHC